MNNITTQLRRRKVLLIAILGFILVIVYFSVKARKPFIPTSSPFPAKTAFPETQIPPNVVFSQKPYYLRMATAVKNASSLNWSSQTLYALVKNEVKSLTDGSSVYKFPEGSVPLYVPNSSFLTVTHGTLLESFDPATKKVATQEYSRGNSYSPSLKTFAKIDDGKISFYTDKGVLISASDLPFSGTISWSSDERLVYLTSGKKLASVLINEKKIKTFDLPDNPDSFSFSPSGKYFSILYPKTLVVYETENFSQIKTISLDSFTKKAVFVWSGKDSIFLVEKEERPTEVDYIYLASPSTNQKIFLRDSYPVPGRINIEILSAVSPVGDMAFAAKEGSIWILSQTPANPAKLPLNLGHD